MGTVRNKTILELLVRTKNKTWETKLYIISQINNYPFEFFFQSFHSFLSNPRQTDDLLVIIITSRKRSFGQGNVFTGVCLSMGVWEGWGWLPRMHHRSHDRHPDGVCSHGGLPTGGVASGGFCPLGGSTYGRLTSQYASKVTRPASGGGVCILEGSAHGVSASGTGGGGVAQTSGN